jgi:hypothetical protein
MMKKNDYFLLTDSENAESRVGIGKISGIAGAAGGSGSFLDFSPRIL